MRGLDHQHPPFWMDEDRQEAQNPVFDVEYLGRRTFTDDLFVHHDTSALVGAIPAGAGSCLDHTGGGIPACSPWRG